MGVAKVMQQRNREGPWQGPPPRSSPVLTSQGASPTVLPALLVGAGMTLRRSSEQPSCWSDSVLATNSLDTSPPGGGLMEYEPTKIAKFCTIQKFVPLQCTTTFIPCCIRITCLLSCNNYVTGVRLASCYLTLSRLLTMFIHTRELSYKVVEPWLTIT